MKLSRKFVSDYIDLDKDLSIKDIAEAMTSVGNEYDSANKLVNATKLITGEVIECTNHPDSDHLHCCKVNIGDKVLDIVCGAPNVRKGIKVIVALDGAKLPGGDIKTGVIRGERSEGMLCSLQELGLDTKFLEEKDKTGIHEFNNDVEVGIDAIKALELDDEVIDFELTSNRGDLLSILGMAHELGAIYKKKVKDIDTYYNENGDDINKTFKVNVETDGCSLFLAKKVLNVTIKESPSFIKTRLIASGIRPINNVVDISNYVMLETGQPLHFYDADKLGNNIIVRDADDGEELITLDNQKRCLSKTDIVIANKNEAVGLAGVMGGLSTEVDDNTKNIIIESAIFDNIRIRKTSNKILRSEASNRFEKGIDPKRTYIAIKRSCALLERCADATIVGGMCEYNTTKLVDKKISVSLDKIKNVLGIDLDVNTVNDIFKSLGFEVSVKDSIFDVIVPTRRLDINIPEDLIEEVGRIYGMDNIKGKLPILNINIGKYNKKRREIRNKLISLGLNETVSYSLIPESEVKKYSIDEFNPIKLADPMSEDRNTLRYSLLYSLKEIYNYNYSHNVKNVSIFEIAKSFYKEDENYKEDEKLAVLISGDYYLDIKKTKVDFYILKGILEELMDYLGFNNRYSLNISNDLPNEFHPGQTAYIDMQGKRVGIIGKLHPSIANEDIYVFEINLSRLLENRGSKMNYRDIPKFPSIEKDLAFILDKNILCDDVIKVIKKNGGKLLSNVEVFDVYEGDKIDSDKKSIAFNLTFKNNEKTLTEDEVMVLFNNIIIAVENKFNAILRDK